MFPPSDFSMRRAGAITVAAIVVFYLHVTYARAADPPAADKLGRIDFEAADLPPANVELDLSQGTFDQLFGIGDAAVAGIAETLAGASSNGQNEPAKVAAEQLAAVRKILGLSGKVIHEVRIRAYEKMDADYSPRFDEQLRKASWERIAVLRKDNEHARVFVVRANDSIRGIFVIAAGDDGQAMVNVVCDISPENVKHLTAAATKIGLENGLQRELDAKFRQMRRSTESSSQPPAVSK